MKEVIIRVQSIELINFKNIENGIIELPSYRKKIYYNEKSDLVGIYGQNGSGKTAVVEAFELFKIIASGNKLPEDINNYIHQSKEEATLRFVLYIKRHSQQYLAYYDVTLSKKSNQPGIVYEKISYSTISEDGKTRKSDIVEFNLCNNDLPIFPKVRYNELIKNNKDNEFNIEVLKRLSIKDMSSLVFKDELIEIFRKDSKNAEYSNIINSIKHFALVNLFVITNRHTAPISLNFIPLAFRMETSELISYGDILIELLGTSMIDKREYEVVCEIIEQLNIVLQKIIPDLKLEVVSLGNELSKNGDEVLKIELISIRNSVRIPLKYESEGIKKIISILSALIAMFNNPTICLIVDELDSGIFEYLLGELLRIIEERAKGQFIFTSHNLRALEMLSKESLVFSTTNPGNRFIRLANIKNNNNLRNVYLRGIDLGGLNEEIYEETNSFEIARAFRKAGEIYGEK